MNDLLVQALAVVSGIVALVTAIHSIATLVETRRKFFSDYLKRKNRGGIK